ncbi:hypothetical protein QGX15_gp072 [Pseudomonas phage psageK4e]|uniref:Uncharacterized protein n=1 Tax=Pseudomonas phage psageK4e TaxID=2875723 RepID=A0AAE8XMP5_9CAUD|nr:hypothetical protein QGX15_gp072 [Pseudomonas phage psageK4e]UAW53623.1 hypothetical protein psageK4e_175 [Pseudomonas phage psageK4e]
MKWRTLLAICWAASSTGIKSSSTDFYRFLDRFSQPKIPR